MLSIFFGDMPEAVYDPVVFFKNTYTDEWITDGLSREMIRDVDGSEEKSKTGVCDRRRFECRVWIFCQFGSKGWISSDQCGRKIKYF
ncbi:MAG: DUF4869 domain-containing protein [Lachnospiraceae bacterium]|nr:DUF4869 domain-containing protein [Lachnospiraceae bacterium]